MIAIEPNEIGYIEGDKVVYPFLNGRREPERTKTPEEEVRLRFITSLVLQYRYSPQRIDIEVTVPRRTPEDRADIVVYRDDALTDPYIVVECKQDGLHDREKQQAIEQGFGNANSLRAPYLSVICGDDEKFYDVRNFPSQERIRNRIPSLPVAYGKAPQYRYSRGGEGWELKRVDLAELNRRFQRCHDAIWESGKRDPAQSFDEMSMLMVAKYYDENKTTVGDYYRCQIGTNEDAPMVASRIRRVFSESKGQNPSVFATSNITVSDQIVYRVVETLQDISLKDTDIDAKGRAFEKFLKLTFKGELGQYFTPLEIKDFMVEMVDPDEADFVVDPACGSGGFLLGCMKHVRDKVKQRYAGDELAVTKADWDFSHKHVWGVDINDRIARVAMLGMILNEDGSSNIACQDSFSDFASFHRSDMFTPNRFSVLLTNPPFGGDVFEPKILANFELGSKGNKKRKTQKTEILMLERCLEFLKPGGRMGIVLPDGILTNSSLAYVREFIEERATLTAVISLPAHAFKPSADVGVKTSLVFLQKKQYPGQEVGDYPIFMAMVEHVGYDATGRDDKNELPEVAEAFFVRSGGLGQITDGPLTYQTRYSELNRRWDAYSNQPRLTKLVADLEKQSNIVPLSSLITHIQYGVSLKPQYASEGIPFLRITNLKPNEVDTTNIVYFPESQRKAIGTCFVREGDILISRSGTIGIAAAVPKEANGFAFGSYMIKFSVAKEVNPSYVAVFINSASGKAQIERSTSGAVQTNITIPAIKGLKIPLPPRPVQEQIAQMMAEAYRERKEKLAKADEIIASIDGYVLERLGIKMPQVEAKKWYRISYSQLAGRHDPYYYRPEYEAIAVALKSRPDIREFGALIEFMSNGIEVRKYVNEGLPYLRVSEMKQGGIDLSSVKLINLKLSDTPNKIRLNVGDLLISRSGSLGQVALATPDLTNCVISSHIIRVVLKEEARQNVNLTYLLTFLQTPLGQKQFQQRNNGAVIPEITQDALKTILVPLPPRPLQDEIAAEVTSRKEQARRLRQEAEQVAATAKENMERMLREESQVPSNS